MLALIAGYRELLERSIDAWNRGDLPAWLETHDPEAEFHTTGLFPGLRPVYRGHDQLTTFWRAMHDPWESLRVDLERFAEGGDWAIIEFRFRAVGAESGVEVDMTYCNADRIRNGLITHVYARRHFDEAVSALETSGRNEGRA